VTQAGLPLAQEPLHEHEPPQREPGEESELEPHCDGVGPDPAVGRSALAIAPPASAPQHASSDDVEVAGGSVSVKRDEKTRLEAATAGGTSGFAQATSAPDPGRSRLGLASQVPLPQQAAVSEDTPDGPDD
jgi:hypothetical protein